MQLDANRSTSTYKQETDINLIEQHSGDTLQAAMIPSTAERTCCKTGICPLQIHIFLRGWLGCQICRQSSWISLESSWRFNQRPQSGDPRDDSWWINPCNRYYWWFICPYKPLTNLVGGLEHFLCFHILGMSSSLIDFHIFRGVGIPPASNIVGYL